MAITFPIAGVSSVVTASRSPSITLGTSPIENDVIVVFASSNSTSSTPATAPTGWTYMRPSGNTNGTIMPSDSSMAAVMLYHVVTAAEDTANTVTWTLTNLWNATETGRITATVLRGVGAITNTYSVAAANAGNSATPWAGGTYSTGVPISQVVVGVCGDGTQTQTTPAGYTLRASGSTSQSNYLYSRDTLPDADDIIQISVTPSAVDECVVIDAYFVPAPEFVARQPFIIPSNQAVRRAANW
jgi:hypothetical protein